jgi:predicted ATPase
MLSVFAGGWTLDAVTAVCASKTLPAAAVLDGLSELVEHSLVQVAPVCADRYRMLEIVRQYAGRRLEERDEGGASAVVRARHLAWCLSLAAWPDHVPPVAEDDAVPSAWARWLSALDAEHDNLRAALAFGLETPDYALDGLRLAAALWPFWNWHGALREGRNWLERALALPDVRQAERDALAVRAAALYGAVQLARGQGAAQAAALYSEYLAIRARIGADGDM